MFQMRSRSVSDTGTGGGAVESSDASAHTIVRRVGRWARGAMGWVGTSGAVKVERRSEIVGRWTKVVTRRDGAASDAANAKVGMLVMVGKRFGGLRTLSCSDTIVLEMKFSLRWPDLLRG